MKIGLPEATCDKRSNLDGLKHVRVFQHFSRPVKNISAKAQRKPKTASTADDEPGTSAGTLACDTEPLHSSQLSSQGLEEEAAEDEEGSLPPVVTADPGDELEVDSDGTPTSTLETKKTKRLA